MKKIFYWNNESYLKLRYDRKDFMSLIYYASRCLEHNEDLYN